MSYNRPDLAVKVNIKTIKGYTMKEIGTLDDRISRLEYYTVLQALETDGNTLSIANNVTGVQRFKNGIFADPFNDFTLSDLGDTEFRISIDSSQSILRPLYSENHIRYQLANTSVYHKTQGKVAMIDYDEEKIEANPLGSTYRNPLEGYYSFVGTAILFPDYDNYTQPIQAAAQDVNIDLSTGFKNLMSTPDTGILTHKDISSIAATPVLLNKTSSTNYWSQTTTNTVKDLSVGSTSSLAADLGDLVTNVANLPFMHGRLVMVIGLGLKPSTRVYPFFDNVNVSQYCSPTTPASTYVDANGDPDITKMSGTFSSDPTVILVPNGNYGQAITTNSKGQVFIVFSLPENTFRTGQRQFTIVNTTDIKNQGAILTSASGTYTASSLSVSKKDVRFNVIEPTFNWNTTSSSTTSNYTTAIPPPPDPPNPRNEGGGGQGRSGGNDMEHWYNSATGEDRWGNDPTDSNGWNGKDWSSDRGNSGHGGKIVCTAMNQTYGFGGFRNAIWLKFAKDNLSKEYEVGYHTLFLPLINYSYNSELTTSKKIVRNALENIARHRTSDIWKISRGKKRDRIGMVYRAILEPMCFIVGWTKLNMFNKK